MGKRQTFLNELPTGIRSPLTKLFDAGCQLDLSPGSWSIPATGTVADMTKTLFILATDVDITGFTPQYIGQICIIYCIDSTADATVTTGAGVTFDGTNDVATFDATGDCIIVIAYTMTRWLVLVNNGTIAFS